LFPRRWCALVTRLIPSIVHIIDKCLSNPYEFFRFQERKEGGKRGRKPGRKASLEKIDMKAKLGMLLFF
jgi:hypothetical protein